MLDLNKYQRRPKPWPWNPSWDVNAGQGKPLQQPPASPASASGVNAAPTARWDGNAKPWPVHQATAPPAQPNVLTDQNREAITRARTVTPQPELDTSAVRGRRAKDTPIAATSSSGLNELGRLRAQQAAVEKAPRGYEVKPMRGETGPEWQTVPRKKHGRLFEALVTGLEGAAQAASTARPGQEIGAVIGGFGTGAAMGGVSPKFREEYERQRSAAEVSAKIEKQQEIEKTQAQITDIEAQARQRAQGTGKIVKGADGQEYVVYGDQAKPITRSDTGEAVKGTVPAEKTVKVGPYVYELRQGKWSLAKDEAGQPLKDTSKPDMIPVQGKDGKTYQLTQKQAFDYVNGSEVTLPNGEKVRLTPGQLATYESGQQKAEIETKKAQSEAEQDQAAFDSAMEHRKQASQELEEARAGLRKVDVPRRVQTGQQQVGTDSGGKPIYKPIYSDNPDYSQADVDYWREQVRDARDYYNQTQREIDEASRSVRKSRASAEGRSSSTPPQPSKAPQSFVNAFKKKYGRAPTQAEIDAYAKAAAGTSSPARRSVNKGGGKYVKPRVSEDDVKRVLNLP